MAFINRKGWVATIDTGRLSVAPFGPLVLAVALFLGQLACGSQSPEQIFEQAEIAAKDSTNAAQAIELYTSFLQQFPKHEYSPKAVKELAVLSQQQEDVQTAILHYERLLRDYPKSQYADDAQFMIAFIYEEYIGDIERARQAYQLVIDNYPDSELANSARHLLPYVGQAPEEWVEFQDEAPSP